MRSTLAILILFISSTAYGACDPETGICTPDPAPEVVVVEEPAPQPERTIVTYSRHTLPAKVSDRSFENSRRPYAGALVRAGARFVEKRVDGHRRRKTRRLSRRAERGNQLAEARLCRMVKSGRAR